MKKVESSDFPTIYIVGCARSGSTILFQLLCRYLEIAYPTNFLSRFHFAPHIGAKLQYLLNDLDYKGENLSAFPDFSLESNLGKTKGPLAPHEFWYYWRNHFELDKLGYVKDPSPLQIKNFQKGLDSIKDVFSLPLILKGMIANSAVSKIVEGRPQDRIIHIQRDILFNAQSLLEARMDYYGDKEKWYSFGIPDSDVTDSPFEQVIRQVIETNRLINLELEKLPRSMVISVRYEDLAGELEKLMEGLTAQIKMDWGGTFEVRNEQRLPSIEWDQLNETYSKFQKSNKSN
ncbi:MAG: hypothetical protein HKO93_04775 [Flavobacteriales bacterium]|nr:hypothetical protein [Flavobacteriales bacterium]